MYNNYGMKHRMLVRQASSYIPAGVDKVRPGQRLATNPEPSPACSEVTICMKPGGGRYQASTQVKVLSPEICFVPEADMHNIPGQRQYSFIHFGVDCGYRVA